MITNKKIMMITTTDNMIWQFLIPHIQHLQELGNTVECVCSKTGFWFDELKTKFGFKVHEINFKRSPLSLKNLKGYRELKKLQKKEKFDLVYCQQPVGGLMGRLIAKKFKLPCIYTAHGFHFFKGNSKLKNLIFKAVEKKLAKYTTALITINEEDYNAAKNWKAKHVYKINGIGYNDKKYTEALPREDIRKSLNLKDVFTILTVAEMIKRKNYATMLKAIHEIKQENIKFLICGTGAGREEVESQIKELGIEDKVQILGYRKDINNIMTASDLFLLPSYQEGLTLSIIEALHFGLPVVTSNVRGNQDLIEDGKGGFICETEDYKTIAQRILEIKNNPKLFEDMRQENLNNASQYDLNKVIVQLEKIYEEVI